MRKSSIIYVVKTVFHVMLLIAWTLIIVSCGSPTENKTYTISGKVLDDNSTGLENATVLVYVFHPLDTSITTFKNDFPQHGAELSMYNEFDHRTGTPIVQTSTNADGTFSLSGISKGDYNIVAYKQDYGYKYIENLSIDQDVQNLQFNLYSVISLPTAITEDIELLSNRFYLLTSDLVILPGVSVQVDSNVTILVSPSCKINVYGVLNTGMNSSLRIMCDDKIYSHSNTSSDIGRFDSVAFYDQSNLVLQNIKLVNCTLGFRFSGSSNVTLSNFYSSSLYQSVALDQSPGFVLEKSTITNSIETMRGAVSIEHSDGTMIEKCHFIKNNQGVRIAYSQNTLVKNNYFQMNSIYDLGFDQDGAGSVDYNTFKNSKTAIDNYRGQINVTHNNIEAEKGIYAYRVNASLTAKYNNLKCSTYGIKSQCMYYQTDIVHLDCTRNYWNTTDTNIIETLIYDRDNESVDDENYYLLVTMIDYLPISNTPNAAGVYN